MMPGAQTRLDLYRCWPATLCLAFLLVSGCRTNVQKTGNLTGPTDPPLAVDWKFLQPPLNTVFFLDSKTGWGVFPDSKTGLGVSPQGVVLATRDGGLTWEPQPTRVRRRLTDLWFSDAKTGWAVGDKVIVSTRDGGATWSFQEQPEALGTVRFVDSRRGWAVGAKGLILATKDGGQSWQKQPSPKEAYLSSAIFLDAAIGWVVGGNGAIFATRNGGEHWVLQKSPVSASLSSVFFLDDRRGWISYDKGVLQTVDGGENWIAKPSPFEFLDLRFSDGLQGKAVAFGPTARGKELLVLSTLDGAETWTETAKLAGSGLGSFRFLDDATGYALGSRAGGIFWTADGGASWTTSQRKDHPEKSVQFQDSNLGWGLDESGHVLVTNDGGSTWNRVDGAKPHDLYNIHFLDVNRGWAVTRERVLVSTTDGGRSWTDAGVKKVQAVSFADPQTGWIAGDNGTILKTENGGGQWLPQRSGTDQRLQDIFFLDRNRGWAAGESGVILATTDGGETWERPMETREDTSLLSVAFANGSTGWAVGSRTYRQTLPGLGSVSSFSLLPGRKTVVLATTDGGRSWTEEPKLICLESVYNTASVHPPDRIGITGYMTGVGLPNLHVEGRISGRGPWVRSLQAEDQPDGSVLLSLRVQDENPAKTELSRLQFRLPGTVAQWGSIQLTAATKASPEGVLTATWKPGDYGFTDNDEITYRVALRDETGLEQTQHIDKTFTYRSRWNQPAVQGAVLGGGLLVGYAAVCLFFLWLAPLALLWVHQHIPLQELLKEVPGRGVGIFANALLGATGLPRLARHPRTRRAWETRYRAGRASFSDLPAGLRASYVDDPSCLDAWVERRAALAEEALQRIEALIQRRVYIELPVRVGPREEGRRLPDPMQPAVRELLAAPCAVLAVLGEGGTGKSTLASQFARWALAAEPASRLAGQRMIPVFLLEETRDLLGSITGQLRSMVGDDEVDEDVVLSLLRWKRLLVLVDALSECTPEMQRHVEMIHRTVPVNALVVTARRRPDFGPVPLAEIWPEKVSPEKLVYFLFEYLRRTGNDELFPDRQSLQLSEQLLGLVERGGRDVEVTPLLIKLFVEQAIALRRAGEPLERLPSSIAETMVESLRRTNPPNPDMPNRVDDATLIRAARVLGRCCLESDYVPRDFFRDTAESELAREGIRPPGVDVVARLVDNGVLEERDRGGTKILRFTLDPLAEYLAALSWLDRLRGDRKEWEKWLDELRGTDGYPERMRGFLIALEDCVLTYRSDFKIPELDLSWNPRP